MILTEQTAIHIIVLKLHRLLNQTMSFFIVQTLLTIFHVVTNWKDCILKPVKQSYHWCTHKNDIRSKPMKEKI